jgi:hypothetical protein
MRLYNSDAVNKDDITDSLLEMLEKDTGKEIFTIRVLGDTKAGLEALVVFKDKSIMMGLINVGTVKGQIAFRVQGNYI